MAKRTYSPPIPRACGLCGGEFTPLRRRTARFCSELCRDRARKGYRPEQLVRVCVECDGPMDGVRLDADACSKRCKMARDRRLMLADPDRRALNRELRKKAQRRYRQSHPEVFRAADLRRRARLAGAEMERVDHLAIFERDGWRCGICSKPVDRARKHPDPSSASVDHIVPLALGGAHAPANCQLAHLGCNVAKNVKPDGAQLRLIG